MKKHENIDGLILFLIVLFLGWFGIDKLYMGNTKLFIIKFLLLFVAVGIIWNSYDIVCAAIGRYKLTPFK